MSTQKTEETGYVVKVYANRDKWLNLLSELSGGSRNLKERVQERVQDFFNEYSSRLSPELVERYQNNPEDIVQLGKDALKEMGIVSLKEDSIDRVQSEIRRNQLSGGNPSAEVVSQCQALLFEIMMPYTRQLSELEKEIERDEKKIQILEEKISKIKAAPGDHKELLKSREGELEEIRMQMDDNKNKLKVAREFTEPVMERLGVSTQALNDNSIFLRTDIDPTRVVAATDLAVNQYYANQSSLESFERIQEYGMLYNQLRFQKMRPDDIKKQLNDPQLLGLLDEKSRKEIETAIEKDDSREIRTAGVRALRLLGFDDKRDRAYLEQTRQQLEALKREETTAQNPDLVNDVQFRVLVENLERENEEFSRKVYGDNVRDKFEVPLSKLLILAESALSVVEKTKPKKALDESEPQATKKDRLSRRRTEADLSTGRPLRSIENQGRSADNLPQAKKPPLLERLRTFTQGKAASKESIPVSTPPKSASRTMNENVNPAVDKSDSEIQADDSKTALSDVSSPSETASPRTDTASSMSDEESVDFALSEDSPWKAGEDIEFDRLIDELELKDKVEQYLGVVNGMEMREVERDPSFKEQLKVEMTQLSDELVKHSESGTIDQGLLEETEEKLAMLQKKVGVLAKNEKALDEIVNRRGRVDAGEEQRKLFQVQLAQKGVQSAIDDVREINLRFQEIRQKRAKEAETSEQTEAGAAIQSVVREDSRRLSSTEMSDEKQPSEISEASAIEEETLSPGRRVLKILGEVMSSGGMLVTSIQDFIVTNVEKRRDAMSKLRPGDQGRQSVANFDEESMADEVSDDVEMETIPRTNEVKSSEKSRSSRAESSNASEKEAGTKNPGVIAGFLKTVREVWADISFQFGPARASTEGAKGVETSATKGESARTVEKAKFNEVRLVGFAGELSKQKVSEKLGEWIKGLENQIGKPSGSIENPPLKFAGEQSIEIKGHDVVMRGFSPEMYREFQNNVIDKNEPTYTVSAANPDSYNNVNAAMGNNGKPNLGSILTSAKLFFEKLWVDAKSLVFGTAASPEIKSVADTTRTSTESLSSSKTSPAVDNTKRNTESVGMDKTSRVEELKAAEPRMSVVEPTSQRAPDPRRVTLAHTAETPAKSGEVSRRASAAPTPNAGLRQSWMCVKVTIEQQPNFESLEATLNKFAKDKGLSPVQYSNNENKFSATINERPPKEGQIKIEASRSGQQVVITEINHSDSSLENMANMVTALPPPGQSKPIVLTGPEGRKTEFKQKVEQSLATVKGPEQAEPPSLGGGSSKD